MATVRASTPLQPTDTVQTVDEAPPAPSASPSPRRRSRRRTAGGGRRSVPAGTTRAMRVIATQRGTLERRAPTTSRPRADHGRGAFRTARPHPRAGGRGDGARSFCIARAKSVFFEAPLWVSESPGTAGTQMARRLATRHPLRIGPGEHARSPISHRKVQGQRLSFLRCSSGRDPPQSPVRSTSILRTNESKEVATRLNPQFALPLLSRGERQTAILRSGTGRLHPFPLPPTSDREETSRCTALFADLSFTTGAPWSASIVELRQP